MTSPRKSRDPKTLRPATQLIHGGSLRSRFEETSEALFLTQGYLYDTMEIAEARFKGEDPGFVYSRFSNPTVAMFEKRMALIEGAEAARATASGMAAVTAALMGQVKAGDHVVAARALFGSCLYVVEDLLPRFGVESTLVEGTDLEQWRAAVRPNTRTAFLESPTNPTLEIIDIAGVAEIVHGVGATLVVDNVFATPLHQHPLKLGADCVVYSATKHIDGQGRVLGGVILGGEQFIADNIHNYLRQTGPSLSPFNAWTLLKSLETLPIRVAAQAASAAQNRRCAGGASGGRAHPLSRPRRSSAGRARTTADVERRHHARFRGRRRQGGRVPHGERALDHRHLQQSRRRQEPDHPSGDHDSPAPQARTARGARHRSRPAEIVDRPRGYRRPDR